MRCTDDVAFTCSYIKQTANHRYQRKMVGEALRQRCFCYRRRQTCILLSISEIYFTVKSSRQIKMVQDKHGDVSSLITLVPTNDQKVRPRCSCSWQETC